MIISSLFQRILVISTLIFVSFSLSTNSQAQEERYTDVSIISEHSAVKPGDKITIATNIKLAPHWHVYWDNPGDSGLPVKIEWDLPKGFEISKINWPTPDKISYDILVNYGYYDEVTLLQTLTVPDTIPEGKIELSAQINMLVCNEICIPENDKISIYLNDPNNLDNNQTQYINQAKIKLPQTIKGKFFFSEKDNKLHLSLTPENRTILNDATSENLEFFPMNWGIINHVAMPEVSIHDGIVTIKHERGDQPISELKNISGLLVIKGEIGKNKGFLLEALPTNETTKSPTINKDNVKDVADITTSKDVQQHIETPTHKDKSMSWVGALLFAFIGGIILNLMPCVFPVLSMKALNLVKMKDKENNLARLHGLSYTFGIVLSFLAFGGIILIFKEAGTAFGWGFQFQSPIIIAFLAYLLFAIGLNLMGFFELGGRLTNVGNSLTKGNSLSSSFFTGVLATIVATPCTAPFMGAAMGFAITQPALISLSVFAMLGFGLALPYLFLSFVPPARHILPKPGAWMGTFKQFLAFPMLASSVWLIWVLSQQTGSDGILYSLLGLLALSFSVWLIHLENIGVARLITHISLIISIILMVFTLSAIRTIQPIHIERAYKFGEAYSKDKLALLLEGNEPIFVEMTAAWCITCKINHASSINIDATKQLFEENNVQYLIGDWTNENPEITAYLSNFGRNGVPLYVYYGRRDKITQTRPKEVVLPQVLTFGTLKEAIDK